MLVCSLLGIWDSWRCWGGIILGFGLLLMLTFRLRLRLRLGFGIWEVIKGWIEGWDRLVVGGLDMGMGFEGFFGSGVLVWA